jgi:CheY-like chemotaxis protein
MLVTIGSIGMLLAALVSHARRLNQLDSARRGCADELHAVETELARAVRSKTEFLAALAHELRNPLTPLRNGIEIVRQTSNRDRGLTRTADMMTRQMNLLVHLIDELLGAKSRPDPDREISAQQTLEPMRLRILVADDNADVAASLAMLLRLEGHHVQTAPDGREAVELAELFRPDVILMDLAMPRLDGVEAVRQIRATPWGKRIRIVALTAWGQESERRRTQEAGMDFHLVKPVDPQALVAILSTGKARHL